MPFLPEYERFPFQEEKITGEDHEDLADYLKNLIKRLQELYGEVATVVNRNQYIEYVAQASQPTPAQGMLIVWKDTDAGTGTPTHYLVYNDGGTVVTFKSDQLVP
ncbi:MAG: hypothetical protein ACETWD_11805 [Desulfatiglandales bacterium]